MSTTKRAWIICPQCQGEGTIVHPACSVWTSEDRDEDPDGFESMMRGDYDVACDTCGGSGKVREPTEAELEEEAERAADRRTRAAENGDWEAYSSPDIARHYYR